MKIEFCLADGGDIILTKSDEELKYTINTITRIGTEINLYFEKDNFIHGYVDEVLYQVNQENDDESLRIFISKDYVDKDARTNNLLKEILKKIYN